MRLTDEELMLRDTAREFAAKELAAHGAEWERTAQFPADALAALGRLGFMGMLVPPEYGGAGADHVGYALALEEIAAGDGSVSTILSVHNSVGCMPVLRYGSGLQQRRLPLPLARGGLPAAVGLSEPPARPPAGRRKTPTPRPAHPSAGERAHAVLPAGQSQ